MKKTDKVLFNSLTSLRKLVSDSISGTGSIRLFLAPSSADLKEALKKGAVGIAVADDSSASTEKTLEAGFVLVYEFRQTSLAGDELEAYSKQTRMSARVAFLKLLKK